MAKILKRSDARQTAYMIFENTGFSINKSEERFFDEDGNMLGGRDQYVVHVERSGERRNQKLPIPSHLVGDGAKDFPVVYETNLGLIEDEDYYDTDDTNEGDSERTDPTYDVDMDLSSSTSMDTSDEEWDPRPQKRKSTRLKRRESNKSSKLEACDQNLIPSEQPNSINLEYARPSKKTRTSPPLPSNVNQITFTDENAKENTESLLTELVLGQKTSFIEKRETRFVTHVNVLREVFEPGNNEDLSVVPKRKRGRPRKYPVGDGKLIVAKPKRPRGRPRLTELDKFNVKLSGFGKGYELEEILDVATSNGHQYSLYVKFRNVEKEEAIPTKVIERYARKQLIDYYQRHLNFNV